MMSFNKKKIIPIDEKVSMFVGDMVKIRKEKGISSYAL